MSQSRSVAIGSSLALAGTGIIGAILSAVIYVEGGYVNDPLDPGGETKYGITVGTARAYGYKGEMKDLTLEQANEIYTNLYVYKPHFDLLVQENPAIAHKLIDAGVNIGPQKISVWFQEILNKLSRDGKDYPKIKEDGVIGNQTLNAYRGLVNTRGKEKACELVLKSLDSYMGYYYLHLRYPQYTVGWLDKRVQNIPLEQCKEYNLTVPLEIKDEDKQTQSSGNSK